MKPRRRSVGGDVVSRSIPLDLIDAIEWDVEAIAALILDDRHFDGALAHEHLLHSAIDADAMLEMNDVIAGLERGEALEGTASRVTPCASEPPFASEDFVIGKNAITLERFPTRRDDEAAIQHSDREGSR